MNVNYEENGWAVFLNRQTIWVLCYCPKCSKKITAREIQDEFNLMMKRVQK